MVVHNNYYSDNRVRNYARALVAAGVQVDVLCPRVPDHLANGGSEGARVFTIPIGHKQHSRLGSYLWEYSMALVLYCLRLIGLYAHNRYQVIHIHNMPDSMILASLLPRLC